MRLSLKARLALSVFSTSLIMGGFNLAKCSNDELNEHNKRGRPDGPEEPLLSESHVKRDKAERPQPEQPAPLEGNTKKRGSEGSEESEPKHPLAPASLKRVKAAPLMTAQMVSEFMFDRREVKVFYGSGEKWGEAKLEECPQENRSKLEVAITDYPVAKLEKLATLLNVGRFSHLPSFIELLGLFKDLTPERFELTFKWINSIINDSSIEFYDDHILQEVNFILECPDSEFQTLKDWCAELGVLDLLAVGGNDTLEFLNIAKASPDYTLKRIAAWNRKAKAFNRCLSVENVNKILKEIEYNSDFGLSCLTEIFAYLPAETYVEGARTLESIHDHQEMALIIEHLPGTHPHQLRAILSGLKSIKNITGFALKEKAENEFHPELYLYELTRYLSDERFENEKLNLILEQIRDYDLLQKVTKNSFRELYEYFSELDKIRHFSDKRARNCLKTMKENKILEMCKTLSDVAKIMLLSLSDENSPLELTISILRALGLCEEISNIEQLCEKITFSNKLTYNGRSLKLLKAILWGTNVGMKSITDKWIFWLNSTIDPTDKDFLKAVIEIRNAGKLDRAYVETCLENLKELNPEAASSILEQKPVKSHMLLRIVAHAYYITDPILVDFLQAQIADPQQRHRCLHIVAALLGQDHQLSQELLTLGLGYENQHNPDGFLAIHKQMMQKRNEVTVHPDSSNTPGCRHNFEWIQKPRFSRPIHMPVTAWNELFLQAKAMDQTALQECLVNLTPEKLWELENDEKLTKLLDPVDSTEPKPSISGYSQMFRAVLKNIQSTNNIETFIQLLVNIRTCESGQSNGITHSYMHICESRTLDQDNLGKDAFKANFLHFISEELLRLRETCISDVVYAVTGDYDPEDKNFVARDPHDIRFVRGIIGHEIGLFFANEHPTVDFDGHIVRKNLRAKNKQELLNLFYEHFTVEKVIKTIQDGIEYHKKAADQSENKDDSVEKHITEKIVRNILEEDVFLDEFFIKYDPELVKTNAEGKPAVLTPKAIILMLIKLGFLRQA